MSPEVFDAAWEEALGGSVISRAAVLAQPSFFASAEDAFDRLLLEAAWMRWNRVSGDLSQTSEFLRQAVKAEWSYENFLLGR